jgi:hypothetical protein
MRVYLTALAAALVSAALWYLALAVALDVAVWLAALLAVAGAALTFFAIARDTGRL